MIHASEVTKVIQRHRGNAVVVSTSKALREWSRVSQRRGLDVDLVDCLDKAAAVGLGVSTSKPDVRVFVLDCDATLRANLATLVTVGTRSPINLVHFLLEDGEHWSTDGTAISGLGNIDFAALAREAGYARTYRFDDLEELDLSLDEVLEGSGPSFVSVKVFYGPDLPAYPDRSMSDSLAVVKKNLAFM